MVAVPATSGGPGSEDLSARGFTVRGMVFSPDIMGGYIAELAGQLAMMWNDKLATKGTWLQ